MSPARPPRALRVVHVAALLGVAGCGGPPAGIPNTPGDIDAASLPDLITVGSPDLPFLLWLTPTQLALEDWRDCPRVSLQEDSLTATAGDCVDSSGVRWYGTVTLSYNAETDSEAVILQGFGADDGEGGWIADGRVNITYVDSGNGFLVDTNVKMTSLMGDSEVAFWANTSSAYANYSGNWYADRHDGHIGKEDWGTAEITTRNTPVAFTTDCGWAAHTAGSMAFDGSNEAFVSFYTGPLEADLAPPADSGPDTDTGADTDTGETELPDENAEPDGACGTCRDAEIGGTELAECLDLGRTFSWPFPPPF